MVVFEVKPWDHEVDLDKLAQEIMKIEKDGLLWITEYKKERVVSIIFKLVIGCIVEDNKVSIDDL